MAEKTTGEARELKFAQNSIDEYGIPWVEM